MTTRTRVHNAGGSELSETWLQVDDLTIDPSYQRPLNDRRVRKIVNEFDPDALGVIYVSARNNGTFVILDGQQRHEALRQMGYGNQKTPCHVYYGLTRAEEARLFVEFNGPRTKPKPLDIFRADVVAGNREACDIVTVLEAKDLVLSISPGAKQVQAVDALRHIYRQAGPDVLKLSLGTCKSAWATWHEGRAYQGELLRAVALVISRYKSRIALSRLIDQLRLLDPSQTIAKARMLRAELGNTGEGAGKLTNVLGGMLARQYNKGLRNHAKMLPPWEERPARTFWDEV